MCFEDWKLKSLGRRNTYDYGGIIILYYYAGAKNSIIIRLLLK